MVLDRNLDTFVILIQVDTDRLRGVFEGIVEQNENHFLERIAVDQGNGTIDTTTFDRSSWSQQLYLSACFIDQIPHIYGFKRDCMACIGAGQDQ